MQSRNADTREKKEGKATTALAVAPMHPCVVEFFGLPGSGKTTVAGELFRLLKESHVEAEFRPEMFDDTLPAYRRHLLRLSLILRQMPTTLRRSKSLLSVVRVPQKSFKDRLKALYNSWTVMSVVSLARSMPGLLILDQGFSQAAWSVALNSPRDDVSGLLENFPVDFHWHVVIFDAPAEVLRARLSQRRGSISRLERADGPELEALWTKAVALHKETAEFLRQMESPGYITVQNLNSDDALPASLASEIFVALKTLGVLVSPPAE